MLTKQAIIKILSSNKNLSTLSKPTELAMFLAQCDHESQGFTRVSENLNYSAEALSSLYSSYFNWENANTYGRTQLHPANQEMIANILYAKRMGNGDIDSGDGWNYRGRGYIQITGKYNYDLCGKFLKLDLINNPSLLCNLQYAFDSAYWFWQKNGCGLYNDNIEKITQIINGGLNGLEERENLFKQYYKLLTI